MMRNYGGLVMALAFLLFVGSGSNTFAQPSPPPPPGRLLDTWDFSGTNFLSSRGVAPTSLTNVSLVPTWAGNGLQVDSTNAAWITYPVVKTNGHTNLSLASGTVETWFSPDWNSADGLGAWGTILEVGNWNTNLAAATGAWGLFISPDGSGLFFSAQTNGVSTNYLNAPISWNAGDWHHLAVTYSATNSALYLEGQFVTNGPGITVIPDASVISNGFSIGSDGNDTGLLQARGVFNDLATYSDQLSAETISNDYAYDSENVYPLPSSGFHTDGAPPDPPGGGTNGDGGVTFAPPVYNTNALWLEITNVLDGLVYLNLNNPTNRVYEILSKTDLLATNWTIEQELWRTNTSMMPFIVSQLARTNLFLWARDWTKVTNNGNTTPDWWFWRYLGTTALHDTNLDSQGNTLLTDYTFGLDPNIISFTLSVTTNSISSNSVPVQLNITAGVASSVAIIINNTNFDTATWSAYTSSNLLVSLGTNDGQYLVWIGLRGLWTNAQQTWAGVTVSRYGTAPLITLTNPTPGTVSRPVIQLQGYVSTTLASLTYDVSNSTGIVTNQSVAITGQFVDTNTATLTANYFQVYDVFLTNGANTVTLHATDLVGHMATTNYTFTLDYSGDTTPPVITVAYPLTNSLVGNTNFTLVGSLDDDTATLIVSNAAQTVTALVERGGGFSVPNLFLPSPTNFFTLFATDAAGNTSTQQLTVLQGSLTLTIDPLSASQLAQPSITLSGTLSDPMQSVWVNGVAATISGNAWSITIAPPTGNNLTALIQGGSDLSSPAGDLFLSVAMPPVVQLSSYQENYSKVENEFCPGPGLTFSNPDSSNIVWSLASGTPAPVSVWGYTSAMTASSSATVFADGCIGVDLSPTTVVETKSLQINSPLQLVAGGTAEMGVQKLIRLTASANPYSSINAALAGGGGDEDPTPGAQIQLYSQILTATSTNADVGEMYRIAAAGATENIAYKAFDASGNLLTNHSIAVQAEEMLQITANGAMLSLDNTSNANFIVGQDISFALTNLPVGSTATNFQWTLDGTFVNESSQASSQTSVNYTNDTALLQNAVITNCWWVSGGVTTPATYAAMVTCTLNFTNGSPSLNCKVKGRFTMLRPMPDFSAQIRGAVTVDTNYYFSNGVADGQMHLHFGINHDISNAGIAFVYSNAPTAPNGTNTYGQYYVTQIIASYDQRYNIFTGDVCANGYETNVAPGLDSSNPYDTPSSLRQGQWSDSPQVPLTTAHWLWLTNSFTNYLMFQPNPIDTSIAVPMYSVQWSWFGSATNNPWGKKSGLPSAGTVAPTYQFPNWTYIINGVDTSPANVSTTNCFDEN